MTPPRKIPDIGQLISWRDLGWTHQQMADHIYDTTGQIVARSSISAALSRAGKADTRDRYSDCLPWRVRTRHLKEYQAVMLRLLGRRRAGGELSAGDNRRLDSWLRQLEQANAVVAYDPDNDEQGFHYVNPRPGDGADGIPIRRRTFRSTPFE